LVGSKKPRRFCGSVLTFHHEVPLRCTCLGGERPLEPAAQLLELEGWPKSLEETKIQTYLQL